MLPQHLVYQIGGTVSIDVNQRPANALVTITSGTGTVQISNANATVDTIATVLMAAATAGDASVTVNSITGIASGSEFWIRTPDEKVRCKTISGSSITLWTPLLQSHANAVSVEGTRVSYSVAAANAATLFWDGRAEWLLDGTSRAYTAVECTRYPLARDFGGASVQDLFAEHPLLHRILDSTEDAERLLDRAHDDVLTRIGGKARARVYTGSQEFIRATVYCALMNHYRRQVSDEAERLYERYKKELDAELERITAIVPRDADQDGRVEAEEKLSFRTVPIYRR